MNLPDWLRIESRSGPSFIASLVVAVCVCAVIVVLGWRWYAGGTVQSMSVSGATVLTADSVRALAHLRSGMSLREVDPERTTARLTRHPWIADAQVRTHPFRNHVAVALDERTPVGRWVDAEGRPQFYLDAHGYALPLRNDSVFDVPLVYDDSISYHQHEPVARPELRQALRAIAGSGTTYDIISGIEIGPDHAVQLYVTHPQGHAMTVRLGKQGYPEKLRRLEAFHTHVIQQTADPVRTIDLRFRGQVITRP